MLPPMKNDELPSAAARSALRQQPKDRFRLQFQQRLRAYLARHRSAPEAFGLVWERTLKEIRLDETAQMQVYWELVNWAMRYEFFTSAERAEILRAWRSPAHES